MSASKIDLSKTIDEAMREKAIALGSFICRQCTTSCGEDVVAL